MKVAIGANLVRCPAVRYVGLKCNWGDYTPSEQTALRDARRVYFPTIFYAGALHAAGKSIFPSMASYHHLGDKVRQLSLFRFLDCPMPRTRLFMGPVSKRISAILEQFDFPFIAKTPLGTGRGRGVFLIDGHQTLKRYLATNQGVSYIQEYIPMDRDLRVVIIGSSVVHAYWKRSDDTNFRTNVAQGGQISFNDIPEEALELALKTARAAGIDYAGFDLCRSGSRWLILEANINFGTEGFTAAGLSLETILCEMVTRGEI